MNETWKTKYKIKHINICTNLFFDSLLRGYHSLFTVDLIVQDTHTRLVKSYKTKIVFKAD